MSNWIFKPSKKQKAINDLIEENLRLITAKATLRNSLDAANMKNDLLKIEKANFEYNQRDNHGCLIRNKKISV